MQYITKEGASITEAFLVTLTCPEKCLFLPSIVYFMLSVLLILILSLITLYFKQRNHCLSCICWLFLLK